MNNPATKEPSMDEILSSIRQIIADDDAAAAPRRPDLSTGPLPVQQPLEDTAVPAEPLALSTDQIVSEAGGPADVLDFNAFAEARESGEPADRETMADFVDPDDVAFAVDADEEAAPAPWPRPAAISAFPPPSPPLVQPSQSLVPEPVRPRPSPARAAPMPDPSLSSDMAEELLEPATNAAVRANFARLNNLGIGTPGMTIESMMREMLRPMLKEWLDEHLPTMVERIVEKEIARISRGVD
jgi:cell pole-organizing protein PopZ